MPRAQYAGGGPGTGFFGNAYEFNAGGTYRGFSADAVYQRVDSVISASAASSTSLKATISDNQSWAGAVRYTMGLGASAIGGVTDDKLTFYLGYEYISFANPSADPSSFIGSTAEGGYLISAVTLNPYLTNKVLQLTWAGVRYDLGANWSFTAGYYHVDQGAYLGTVSKPQAGTIQTSANSSRFLQRRIVRGGLPTHQALRCVCRGELLDTRWRLGFRLSEQQYDHGRDRHPPEVLSAPAPAG